MKPYQDSGNFPKLTDEQVFNIANAIRPYIPGEYKAHVLVIDKQPTFIICN